MFFIRADGNQQIAMGHIMRCLTIAEALRTLGEEILFLTADENPVNMIKERGFAVEILHTRYDDMETELPKIAAILGRRDTQDRTGSRTKAEDNSAAEDRTAPEDNSGAWDKTIGKPKILVDSYFVTPRYLEKMQHFAKVILMDDEKKTVYPCDGLVNYSIYGKTLGYEADYPAGTKLFLGTEYMPLRRQFRDCPYEVRDTVKDILFTTGGGDSSHAALRLTERLLQYRTEKGKKRANGSRMGDASAGTNKDGADSEKECGGKLPVWHIVCGPYHPDTEKLEALAAKHPFLRIHKNVTSMSELMQKCDIAVSAAGSTLYELCSIGIPTVGFYFAENQRRNMETFAELTPVKNAGDFSRKPDAVLDLIEKEVEVLCREKTSRQRISRNMKNIVDGRGADRLAESLLLL